MSLVFQQTVAPAKEPVTVAELKAHLRIDGDAEDTLLGSYIKAATRTAEERYLRRQLITATWTKHLDAFPADGVIELERPPLQSVTSIQYVDAAGETQTLDAEIYDVDTASEPGRVLRTYVQAWPTVRNELLAVTITYVAGYGDEPTDVPEEMRVGIMYLAAHFYNLREPVITGTIVAKVPLTIEALFGCPQRAW